MWWNCHHLVLFHFVARHGGISAALPHIPFSIQQPALSEQMKQLEQAVGHRLFTRHPQPFALTAAGERIYARLGPHLDSLFRELDTLVRGPCVRVGAPPFVVDRYLPAIVAALHRRRPDLGIECTAGSPTPLIEALGAGQLDLAIVVSDVPPPGFRCTRLFRLPLALYLPKTSPTPLRRLPVDRPLVCPHGNPGLRRQFDAGLRALGLTWYPRCRVDSVSAVPDFVRAGLGIGLGLAFAPLVPHPDLRIVPLPRFKPLQVMVLSHRDPGPDTRAFIEEIEHVSRQPANLADGCGSRPRSRGS